MQSWYDEVKDYTYPYPHECNPWCPERCSGAMCTHYTQVIWVPQTWGACLLRQMQECLTAFGASQSTLVGSRCLLWLSSREEKIGVFSGNFYGNLHG